MSVLPDEVPVCHSDEHTRPQADRHGGEGALIALLIVEGQALVVVDTGTTALAP